MIPAVKLKHYISQIRGIAYKPNEIAEAPFENSVPLLKANNITDGGLDNLSLIYIDSKKIRPEQFIRAGDLLLAASSGSKKAIGKNAHFPEAFPGSFGAFCKVVRPKNELHSDYLKHFFKTSYYRSSIEKAVQGANINNLRNEHLDDLEIPLPLLDDQIRIAHLLGKVEGLIAQRKQHLQQLDDLLKSVFLEMFGDPVRNEKGWEMKEITNVCNEIVDCVNKTAPQVNEQTSFIMVRTSNIRGGRISLDKVKYVDAETYKIWTRRSKPCIGDILFTREAPMGEVGLIDFNDQIFLGQRIMQYRCNPKVVNPKFILELMKTRFFQQQIEKLGKGSTVKHLTVPDCYKFIVIVPLLSIQNQFAAIVEKVETLKSRYQQSLTDLESLYGALSQQAFKGELDLSRVPLV